MRFGGEGGMLGRFQISQAATEKLVGLVDRAVEQR
jgi:hypothetical protein